MKLWLLRPVRRPDNYPWNTWPWEPPEDKTYGFVVRAESEAHAREFVATATYGPGYEGADVWRSSEFTSCVELSAEGDTEIIMRDFAAA